MADRGVGPPGDRLAACEVVERRGVAARLQRLPRALDHRLVRAGFVLRMDRRPDLPAATVIGLSDGAANREHRRAGLLAEGGSIDLGPDEHARSRTCVPRAAVQLPPGAGAA